MKDLHSHILYGIDDGSKTIEKSIELLKSLEKENVTDLVLTPHYIIGTSYNSNNSQKRELLNSLKRKTKINLYLGNEVYIDNKILEYIKKDEINTINNSKYLLIEFPLNERLDCMFDIVYDLLGKGIIPIIAHPERYRYLKLSDLISLIESGCLFQGNITSLNGKYGKEVKKNLELLLSKNMIHLIGTDTHRNPNIDLDKALEELKKIVGKEKYKEITEINFDKVINDVLLEPYKIVEHKHLFKKEKII